MGGAWAWQKRITNLCKNDKHVEPFMYPLFFKKETFVYSEDIQLRTPHQHLTRIEFAQYQIAFSFELTDYFSLEAT